MKKLLKLALVNKAYAYGAFVGLFVAISLIMNMVSIISMPIIKIGTEWIDVPWALPLAALMMVVADVISECFTRRQTVIAIVMGYLGGLILSLWLMVGEALLGSYASNNFSLIIDGELVAHFFPWDALSQSWRFFLAGFIAYVVANIANTGIMWYLKKRDGKHKVGKRIILSTIVGQILDNVLFLTLAFAPIGLSNLERPWRLLGIAIGVQIILEIIIEIILSPFTKLVINSVNELPTNYLT